MNSKTTGAHEILTAVENWVQGVVVRHRFCPFAKPALQADKVSYFLLNAVSEEQVLQQIADRVEALVESGKPDSTELLVLSNWAKNFDDFLDLVAIAEALLESMDWNEQVQFATFHPDYCFAETSPHAMENYTNRAPWPVIQLLQVDALGQSIEGFGNTEDIPARNIAFLNQADDAICNQIVRDSTPVNAGDSESKH